MDQNSITQDTILRYVVAAIVVALLLFVPAGTIDYWQAWVFLLLFFAPMMLIVYYLYTQSPDLLKRRLKTKEQALMQIILAKTFYSYVGMVFIISGLDKRFGWSAVPLWVVFGAVVIFLAGYFFLFLVFKENKYLAHTVVLEKDQQVVSTGPYAVVRHPMYLAELIMFFAAPFVLGSYWAGALIVVLIVALVLRILTEEQLLLSGLAGYKEYTQKTKWRLVPGIW
ncbi:MAG: isoprenylcysteine carboxylmethyltransferase family protein [Candidatus Omnitrophica bacterium]|nr:isoprenylcysteine carboxylmethyltransferase family protein [Candidatus Omnitrophota bacterium]